MAYIISKLWSLHDYVFKEAVDPRSKDLFLVGKPFQLMTVVILYQMFVFRWGPQWMKNRQPYKIDKLVMAFDIMQVICCSLLFYKALSATWLNKYKLLCEPIDYSNSENGILVSRLVYSYFLLKISDLLDTVFFVLRNKTEHITFLHVYHHSVMVIASWLGPTFLPGGHGIAFGILNCLVHAVMYGYYFITLAKPEYKKYIWLKKFVTQVQIVQFLINVVHMGSALFVPNCEYPLWVLCIFLPNNFFMLVLFSEFYTRTYIKKSKSKA